jgi:hypothetical protein
VGKFIDMTGWVMSEHGVPDSRLTVIERTGSNNHNESLWLCECNCEQHTRIVRPGGDIRNGTTKSCGCLRREVSAKTVLNVQPSAVKAASQNNKGYNEVVLNLEDKHGLYGIGYCHNTGKEFYFDMDDYDKIKDICWNEQYKNMSTLQGRDLTTNRMVRMHSFLGYTHHDHADRNELNNRKYNLRPATTQENARNHNRQKNNTSGVIGVGWLVQQNKWRAYIYIDKKHIGLGTFDNKNDAIIARLKAEQKYFGEFAPQKHLYEQYGIIEDRSEEN